MASHVASVDEPHPPLVESPVAFIATDPGGRGRQVPAIAHRLSDPVAGPVVPGSLDHQPAGVIVAGLRDRSPDLGGALVASFEALVSS
jgi:hypothetical protein